MRRARLKVPQDRPVGACDSISRIVDRLFRSEDVEKEHFVWLMRGLRQLMDSLTYLGQGGMGIVYKARQPKLDRIVAR